MTEASYILRKDVAPGLVKQVKGNFDAHARELFKNGDVLLICKPYKKSMTGQQRKYAHALLSIIANHSGNPLEDLKRRLKVQLGLIEKHWVNGEVITEIRSTESLKRDEYGVFINAIIDWCNALGLDYPDPSHYGYDEIKD